jgi:transporter family-2 protein
LKIVYLLFAFAAGAALAFQAGVNTQLSRRAGNGPVWAAMASFAIGTLILLIITAGQRTWPQFSRFTGAPWYIWAGGLLGAAYVVATIVLAPKLGVAVLFSLTVGGQMIASVVIDRFGWLGFQVRPLSPGRLLGAALIIAGVFLIRRF